jgi:hypothetical protein
MISEHMPAVSTFLINLCTALLFLNLSFIISTFVGASENTCKAFSFLLHYFLLVCCISLALMVCFTGVGKPSENKKKFLYLATLLANWSKYIPRV